MISAWPARACLLSLLLLLPGTAFAVTGTAGSKELRYSVPAGGNAASGKAAPAVSPAQPLAAKQDPAAKGIVSTDGPAACWLPLLERLKADGLDGPDLAHHFGRLGDGHSPLPMSTKVTELFKAKYLRPAPSQKPKTPTGPPRRVYPNIITQTNLEKCRAFLKQHAAAFDKAEKTYKVPKEVIVSLLFVETRLGDFLGTDNAFRSLASMAASNTPDHVADTLKELPMTPDRMEWLQEILVKRSDWAYGELKALLVHSRENKLDPLEMPGSVYGAVGLCQFMPSNFKKFAVDGNDDGKIDLFDPADAIVSVGNYLSKHGWKTDKARDSRQAVLKRYNNSTIYANTILTMSESFAPKPQPAKTNTKAAPAKGNAKSKTAAKAASKPAAAKPAAKPAPKAAAASKPAAKPVKVEPVKIEPVASAGSSTSASTGETKATSSLGPRVVLP